MRRALSAVVVVLLCLLAAASPASAAPRNERGSVPRGAGLQDRDANRISDEFDPDVDAAQANDRFAVLVNFSGAGSAASAQREVGTFSVKREYRSVRGFAATMTAAQIRSLARNPNVRRIERDITVSATLDASRRDFGIDRARTDYPSLTGSGAGICILDTGLDAAHEQFDSKTITWQDFVSDPPTPTPFDDHGHGTHVANIAAGDGTGSGGATVFRGVAPGAPLWVGKVLDGAGNGDDSDIVAGVEWCGSQPGVRVISMSIGTIEGSDGLDILSDAVNSAVKDFGKIVVVAAGNSGDMPGSVGSPGAAVHAVTVGAVAEWSAPVNAGGGRHSDGVYLAPFSSRGPTLGNAMKPDIAAPGVTVAAAAANQCNGVCYVANSGTSMATPFVAGTVALALQAQPALTPAGAKQLVETTAQDRGATGKDNEWGAGLLDGYAVVSSASGTGSYTATAFPNHNRVTGSVPNNGQWNHQFTIGSDALDVPIAAAVTLNGTAVCVFPWPPDCLAYEWDPDLEARLFAPDGTMLSESTCAADDECGIGRQETVHAMPTTAGTYTVQVYTCNTSCGGNGEGGSFTVDLSFGPVGGAPPPPVNQPPVANAGADQSVADSDGNGTQTVTLNGSGSTDADGTIQTYEWKEGATTLATAATAPVTLAVGTHSITLTVTDDDGATATDQVVITVNPNTAPNAAAGPDQTVTDSDGNGSQSVTLDGSGSTDPGGSIVSYSWSEGGTTFATGATVSAVLGVGVHAITLTVTDNGGLADTDQLVVTVQSPVTMHVADLEGAAGGKRNNAAVVTITVHDQNHNPLVGVVVSGTWTGGFGGSCTTDASGRCSVSRSWAKKQTSLTFTVSGLSKSGFVYRSSENHDLDGDTNGTAVTVAKP